METKQKRVPWSDEEAQHCERTESINKKEGRMKNTGKVIKSLVLMSLIWVIGCSGEDRKPPLLESPPPSARRHINVEVISPVTKSKMSNAPLPSSDVKSIGLKVHAPDCDSEIITEAVKNINNSNEASNFSLDLPVTESFCFVARAFSEEEGEGHLLFEGSVAGVNLTIGGNSISINLGAVGTMPPVALTQSASDVRSTSAVLNGIVNASGYAGVVYIEFGPDSNLGSKTPIQKIESEQMNISQTINGLQPGSSNFFRLVAVNSSHTVYGKQIQFTTLSKAEVEIGFTSFLPSVTTQDAVLTATSATLNCMVNPKASTAKTYFEFGATESYGSTTELIDIEGGEQTVSARLSGFSQGTSYHYRCLAFNAAGLTLGGDKVFSIETQSRWQKVTIPGLPAGAMAIGVWSSGPNDVYVSAYITTDVPQGFVFHWNGTNWNEVLSLPEHGMGEIFGTSAFDVYALAYKCTAGFAAGCGPDRGGRVFRSTDGGVNWVPQILPAEVGTNAVRDISGTSGNVHVAGPGFILRFDGASWSTHSATDVAALTILSATEGYFTECWGWGKWNGTSWQFNGRQFDFCDIQDSWGIRDESGNLHLYAVGNNNWSNGVRVWKFSEATQSFSSKYGYVFSEGNGAHAGTANRIWGSAWDDVYVTGCIKNPPDSTRWCDPLGGRLYHFDGTSWTRVMEIGEIPVSVGIWGTGSQDIWVTLGDGRLLHYAPPVAEVCDGADNDLDGLVDEGFPDTNGNGVADCVDTKKIGGTVSGLMGTDLVLQNNGGDDIIISSDGAFTFSMPTFSGAAYAVTVLTHPMNPSQTCTVKNGFGIVGSGDVTHIDVSCITDTFSIGGSVLGLTGTGLVLRNNGEDDLPISTNGEFTFNTTVLSGETYGVTVFTQPINPIHICTVTDGSGTVGSESVTNVRVICTAVVDPLFEDQWHLQNTGQAGGTAGQDVNVLPVWDAGIMGAGVRIAIVDDGLEIAHEDISPNVVAGQSYNYLNGTTDPTAGKHGTSVGGVAASRDSNGLGGAGAAPRATLVSYNLLENFTSVNEADAMTRNAAAVFVSNNSWGPTDDGRWTPSESLWRTSINTGLTTGRNGKGTIYTWAAGNGGSNNRDNSNYDGYANYRGVLSICAVEDDGVRASYSERGANLWVCAPSRGRANHGITTTDRTGVAGYSINDYTNTFGGTSSSAPLAAGVTALVLEANPNLTWRDLQLVLAQSARKNRPTEIGWATNGAGFNINHNYGFGVINADAAVSLAKTWVNIGPEITFPTATTTINLPIPDNNIAGISDAITVADSGIGKIEFVDINFNGSHTYVGDLDIVLTAPSGTVSRLSERHLCSGGCRGVPNNTWRFSSVRHLGEAADGTWTITVKDLASLDMGTFTSWQLTFYGRAN